MSLSLIIVSVLTLLGLGLIIYVSSPSKIKSNTMVPNETIAPLLFTTPLLSWLVYVKYNDIEASFFISVPITVIIVMLLAFSLLIVNLRK